MHKLSGQSAMEYLMTYGWAILIIAVVLGAIYQLGIFKGTGGALQPSCLASTGYFCSTPILNTTGFLGVTFGQIGQTMTITNLACTKNLTTPAVTQNVALTIPSGARAALQFSCPTSANSIGTIFSGYLWITYNSPTQSGIIDRFALVTAKIQTSGNVTSAQQAGGQGGTTTTSTSTSTSSTTTSIATTTILYYTATTGPVGTAHISVSIGSGTQYIGIATAYYDSGNVLYPSTVSFTTNSDAFAPGGTPGIGLSGSSITADNCCGGSKAIALVGLQSPPGVTVYTNNGVGVTTKTLSYTVSQTNSFVVIAIASKGPGFGANVPVGCSQIILLDDGAEDVYSAVCSNPAVNSYNAIGTFSGASDVAMAAYVYH
ncbi:MAG: hypothetical protein KGH53_03050 [Candidatus Micrarchaeota archaeon]|nr:hypothetical protein [Candidatus Micrarchaeota archaeon]